MSDNRRSLKPLDALYPNRILNNLIYDYVNGAFTDYKILHRAIVVQIDYVGGQLSGAGTKNTLDWSNPKGSIKARIISKDRYKSDDDLIVFWPLFSHFATPIKEGEEVYVLFEDPNEENRGLWICRCPEPFQDDQSNPIDNQNLVLATDKYKNLKSSVGLDQVVSDTDFPPTAITQSQEFTQETVVPFTPRVGEMALEGSNNALILLGRDRPDLSPGDGQTQNAGTITLVTGRTKKELLDLKNDKSVVYISQNTDGDTNFNTANIGPGAAVGPTIVVKSDEIIIIAAKGMKVTVKGDLTLDAASIELGNQAKEPAVLGNQLMQYLQTVVVNTPAGPGSLTPPPQTILSQIVTVKDK